MKLRARVGDNLTSLTKEFLEKKGITETATHDAVLSMMRDAGGARCDACKTMVEQVTTHLREVSTKARPQGLDAVGAARVSVDDSARSELANQVCSKKQYLEFNDKVQAFCKQQLGGPNLRPILRAWEGQGLEARFVPERKKKVCTDMLKECPARSTEPSVTKCTACMEAFQTLEFLVRRDSPSITFGGEILSGFGKSKKKVPDGFGSSLH